MPDPIILAQIGVGWLFIRYLLQKDYGTKEPKKAVAIVCLLGVVAVVGSIIFESIFLPDKFTDHPEQLSGHQLFGDSLIVGVIEECFKSLPIAIFLYGKRYFNETNDGLLYFGIGGMVFGVIEDIGYELAFPGSGVVRLLTGPYLHAGFCILFGYLLARRKLKKNGWWLVAVGLLASIAFHGLYDFGLFYHHGWSMLMAVAITIAINLNIFYLLKRTRREDAALGIASATTNYYCPYCGRPNPQKFPHCPYCGRKA